MAEKKSKLTDAQKRVISNIFRDLTKLTIVALVLGQFVPGQVFSLVTFLGGMITSVILGTVATLAAVEYKEAE